MNLNYFYFDPSSLRYFLGDVIMIDKDMGSHAVGAGLSLFFGGPIGLALYVGYTAAHIAKRGDFSNGKDSPPPDWIGRGLSTGRIGKIFDK
jgi:hypothetical protein